MTLSQGGSLKKKEKGEPEAQRRTEAGSYCRNARTIRVFLVELKRGALQVELASVLLCVSVALYAVTADATSDRSSANSRS